MSAFKDQKLLHKSKGELADAEEELKDMDFILVYFSAHWCPPCRGFTPVLKDFYESEELKDKKFAIVFVSSDRSDVDMKSYWNDDHGDWYAVPHGSELLIKTLKKNCSVSGIPKLCVVNKNGDCIHGEARGDVQTGTHEKAFQKFKELSK